MADKFSNINQVISSARKLFAVTPHNTNELTDIPKGLYIGGAGNIEIIAVDDTDPVILMVTAGQILPIRAKIVKAANTTATGIVALA